MSATRDKTQKSTFVYSNLYQLYKKGTEAAKATQIADPSARAPSISTLSVPVFAKGQVLKAEDLNSAAAVNIKISEYEPTRMIGNQVGKRIEKPAAIRAVAPSPASQTALDSLKDNLKTLNDLHSRLRFMLKELEDLVKE